MHLPEGGPPKPDVKIRSNLIGGCGWLDIEAVATEVVAREVAPTEEVALETTARLAVVLHQRVELKERAVVEPIPRTPVHSLQERSRDSTRLKGTPRLMRSTSATKLSAKLALLLDLAMALDKAGLQE